MMLRSLRLVLPVPMLVLAAACTSSSANFRGEIARTDPARIHVCHGFDCHYTTRLDLTDGDRQQLARIMNSGRADPARERAAISRAVQYFEERSTEAIGVRDAPRSHIGQSGQTGQMDCIDVSTNTRSLLLVLDELGLLRHHTVERNVSRGAFLDGRYPHSTAVVREKASGEQWAIDGWYGAGGDAPEIKPLSQWQSEGVLGRRDV